MAVLCHENPHVDLKKKYTYEKLLEQYVKLLGYIDPDDHNYARFRQAQNEAQGLVTRAKNKIRETWSTSLIQRLMAIFLGFVPLSLLLTEIILNIIDNPSTTIGGWTSYLFYGLGIVAAAVSFFALDSDGCLVPIIIGAIVSFLITFIISVLGFVALYLYGFIVLFAIVFFSVTTLFDVSKKRKRIKNITNPGFEELTLEPLYFAFNNESKFDSSLNGAMGIQDSWSWKEDVKKRWKMVLAFVGCTFVLMLFRFALPKSERMDRFDKYLKKPFNTEITQYDEVQELPDPEP